MSEREFLRWSRKILADNGSTVVQEPPALGVDWPRGHVVLDFLEVQPLDPPTESSGGLTFAKTTVLAGRAMTCVGQVIDIGSRAFTAHTRDGVDYPSETYKPAVGDWIMFTPRSGIPQPVKDIKSADPQLAPRRLLIKDNDVIKVFDSEAEARKVLAWVA